MDNMTRLRAKAVVPGEGVLAKWRYILKFIQKWNEDYFLFHFLRKHCTWTLNSITMDTGQYKNET